MRPAIATLVFALAILAPLARAGEPAPVEPLPDDPDKLPSTTIHLPDGSKTVVVSYTSQLRMGCWNLPRGSTSE